MNRPKKIIPVKYFLVGGAVIIVGIAALFIVVGYREAATKKLLLEKGVHTSGWVLQLTEYKTKKKRGNGYSSYYMDVAYFADTAAIKPVTKDTAVSKAKNGPDLVDKLFNKMESERRPIGAYQTLSIPISRIAFQKYNVDDKVKIVYLKEDPTVLMLEEQIQ
jgi:hypothetical protein